MPGTSSTWVEFPLFRRYESARQDANNSMMALLAGARLAPAKMRARVDELLADIAVENKRGIYEYVLSGGTMTQLLDVRLFDGKTKQAAYARQTTAANANGESNCPMCAVGSNANKVRIYKADEMEADHVSAWSKGGSTDLANCEMLCVPHNRAKGNR